MDTTINLIQSFLFTQVGSDFSSIIDGLIQDYNNFSEQVISIKTELTNGAKNIEDILGTIITPKGCSIDIPKGINSGFDPKWLDLPSHKTVEPSSLTDYLGDPCKIRKPLLSKTQFCSSALSDIFHEVGLKCSEFCSFSKSATLDYIRSIVPDSSFIVFALPSITIYLQNIAHIVFDLQFNDDSNTLYLETENNLFRLGNVFDVDVNVWRSNTQLYSSYSTRIDVTDNLNDLQNAVQDRDAAGDVAIETFNSNMETYDQAQRDDELDDITYDEFNIIETRMVRASHQTADIVRSILGDHDNSYIPEPRGENAIHFSHITITENDITYVTPNSQTNSELSISTAHQLQQNPEASVFSGPNNHSDSDSDSTIDDSDSTIDDSD